ncbi:MAG: hypothetical protein KatS3mg031_3034 [Chitinophagales bacterium]|nr:MAG: hypothetical protein KatS3mg031_3034 [Chitinophagales bacterium]
MVFVAAGVIGGYACAGGTVYELYPNFHTIGIMVVSDQPFPPNVTTSVHYEENIQGNWSAVKQGLPLSRVSAFQYAGCILQTKPGTMYRIRCIIMDSTSVLFDQTDTATARNEPAHVPAQRVFYVSPGGSGISQNITSPGSLDQSLLDILQAGDKVMLLPGTYFTGGLQIKSSGTARQPIVFEGGPNVVLDGSFATPIQWTRVSTDTAHRDYNMFFATLGPVNTNCVVADGKRLYPYRNLLELSLFQTIRLIDANGYISGNFDIALDGFFRDGRNPSGNYFPYTGYNPNTYIKFADGSDTTGKTIHVSRQSFAFSAAGLSHIWFSNITFRYFGAGTTRTALHFTDCDNLLIDSCHFQFCDRGVSFYGNADNNIIQHCRFDDDLGDWTYFQFKETNVDYGQPNTFYPNFFPFAFRNVEPGRVYFDRDFTGRGNVIRYNVFHGLCDGITCPYSPGDSTTSRHFDIYGNTFMHGADDAFEVDGNASNIRIWDNVIHDVSGISVAPPCYGPVYIFRNIFYDLPQDHYEYIYRDITGYHLHSEPVSTSPLKLNASYCDLPGEIYFLHNTCDTGPQGRGFYIQQPQAQSSWANVISRNNIFYVESNEPVLWIRGTDNIDLDYNNYYCTQTFTARQDRPGYGLYHSLQEVSQNILGDINDSASFIETHGYQLDPSAGWKNEPAHDYHLLPASNMVDKGILIPGVNDDFSGAAPDLGAFELVVQRSEDTAYHQVLITDTTYIRDTITSVQDGITDTIVISAAAVSCDSLMRQGSAWAITDSLFLNDTLFIHEALNIQDTLIVGCTIFITDSLFIPGVASGWKGVPDDLPRIFPNPNDGCFYLSLPAGWNKKDVTLHLYDLSGKEIPHTWNKDADNGAVKVDNLHAQGAYLLTLKDAISLYRFLIVVTK